MTETADRDEQLLLFYYEDGLTPAERADIARNLRRNPALAQRYRELSRFLESIDAPVHAASDGQRARWHASLPGADERTAGRGVHVPSFAWGVAATVVLAVGALFVLRPDSRLPTGTDTSQPARTASTGAPHAAFSRGLRVHLLESQRNILDYGSISAADHRDLILDIIEQNRLFERAAERHRADDVARLLRALEPVLLQLAAERPSADETEQLKAQLAFELEVMLTKLARQPSMDTERI